LHKAEDLHQEFQRHLFIIPEMAQFDFFNTPKKVKRHFSDKKKCSLLISWIQQVYCRMDKA
jgi:hypothetical protein